ncbi:MAG: hypothetical protein N2747_03380 [Chitinophagaceae bacterium]|nr:hypothetical protein [Chitinophagaceae bacterium]
MQPASNQQSVMTEYILYPKHEKKKYYQSLGWFLILQISFFFIFRGINAGDRITLYASFVLAGLLLVFLWIRIFLRIRFINHHLFFFLLSVYAFLFSAIESGLLILLFWGMHSLAVQSPKLKFSPQGIFILYGSVFLGKKIQWKNVEHVVLKDNLLTIETTNNRIIQMEIAEQNNSVPESDFNEFCKRRIESTP